MIKIIVWGCGLYGRQALEFLKENNSLYEIAAVCDTDVKKIGQELYGYVIKGISEIDFNDADMLLLCANKWESMLVDLDINFLKNNRKKVFCWKNGIKRLIDSFAFNMYSQDGEELYLQQKFADVECGTYVDVGALHPYRYNNTIWAYEKGWRGINVEPNPDGFKLFEMLRPEDKNYNCGASSKQDVLIYYQFEEPGLNTFEKEYAQKCQRKGWRFLKSTQVKVIPLEKIFEECKRKYFDFIDIDVETHELDVLKGIDFNKVEFGSILIEQGFVSLKEVIESPIAQYLEKYGYVPVDKYNRTVMYEKR